MNILNESQMNVFTQIVYLREATIGKLAQATGMHRQSVKIVLQALIHKGFVRPEQKRNKIFYHATSLDLNKKIYLSELDKLKKQIPSLKAMYEDTQDNQIISALTGKSGLRSALVDEVIKGKEVCSFHLAQIKHEEEYKANEKRRASLNIPIRVLTPFDVGAIALSKVKKTKMRSKINLYIYADKFTLIYEDVETKLFTIKIPEITRYFQSVFDKEWKDKTYKS